MTVYSKPMSESDAEIIFGRLVRGQMNENEMRDLLLTLRERGETPAEIAGAARAMRAAATKFDANMDVADSCGTGGDGLGTFNVSTAVALVAAECGVPMAKHGNRSISSRCGSADVLEALGVNVEATPAQSLRSLQKLSICFLYAPLYHAGLRHAMNVRKEVGRSILNLLGPLSNPAAPTWQIVGVYDERYCVPVAETLARLGCQIAMVVHGSGLDEIAVHGPTTAAFMRDGRVKTVTLNPGDVDLDEYPLSALGGGDLATNTEILRAVIQGRGDPAHTAAVAINAGALLMLSGRTNDFKDGVRAAMDVLMTGRPQQLLWAWADLVKGGG